MYFELSVKIHRQVVESPVEKVKRLGNVVGLANHTILIAKAGREIHIDDSGSPIRNDEGQLTGVGAGLSRYQ